MASEQQPAAAGKPEKKYCDICWLRGGKQGLHIQTCRRCGVSVHKECYGNAKSTAPVEDFLCLACRAVGTTVKVRERDARTGQRLQLTVEERPTECCLCSVDDAAGDWPHAMHPVYDHYGDTGRQLLLPPSRDKPPRTAWAHTLCCLAVGSHPKTAGCVYGCTSGGEYDGADDENSDTSSVNSDLQAEDSEEDDDAITHFVYCRRRTKHEPHNQWTKAIQEQQNELRCTFCGEDDSPPGILRIPLQCSANDDNEYKGFRGTHAGLGQDTCYVPMHVGCAFWGRRRGELPAYRRVYFFPGREEQDEEDDDDGGVETDTVINIYCEAPAEDLAEAEKAGRRTGATTLRYPKHLEGLRRKAAPASPTAGSSGGSPSVARMAQERGRAKFQSSPTKPSASDRGDVRSRLGLRDPVADRRPRSAAAAAVPGPKRPAVPSSAHGTRAHPAKKKKRPS